MQHYLGVSLMTPIDGANVDAMAGNSAKCAGEDMEAASAGTNVAALSSSWAELPGGVAGEIAYRLTTAVAELSIRGDDPLPLSSSSSLGPNNSEESRKDLLGQEGYSGWVGPMPLELLLGSRGGTDGQPGPIRLVCSDWARLAAENTLELQPSSLDLPRDWIHRFANIRSLDLSSCMGLSLQQEDLGSLRFLRTLRLPSSACDSDLASVVAGLSSSLTDLSLPLCRRITDDGVQALQALAQLTALDLTGCLGLTPAGLRPLGHLPYLTMLSLSDCGRCVAPSSLAGMAPGALRHLVLDDSRVGSAAMKALVESQPRLTALSLQYCGLGDEDLGAIASLLALQRLWLTGNADISGPGAACLAALTRLEELAMGWCPGLNDSSASPCLSALRRLTTLTLAGCPDLGDLTMQAACALPYLATLSMEDADRLTDSGCTMLADHSGSGSSLTALDLNGCSNLTERSLSCLVRLKNLRTLDMRGTRVSTEAAEALRGSHPHLRVSVRGLAGP